MSSATWAETDGVEIVGELIGLEGEETATLRTSFSRGETNALNIMAVDENPGEFGRFERNYVWDDDVVLVREPESDPRWFDVDEIYGGVGEEFPESDFGRFWTASLAEVLTAVEREVGQFSFGRGVDPSGEVVSVEVPFPVGFPFAQPGDPLSDDAAQPVSVVAEVDIAAGVLATITYEFPETGLSYVFRFEAIDSDQLPDLPSSAEIGTYEDFYGEPPPDN